jgi:hypothetical protein
MAGQRAGLESALTRTDDLSSLGLRFGIAQLSNPFQWISAGEEVAA